MMRACDYVFMLGLWKTWKPRGFWKMNVQYYEMHLGRLIFFSFDLLQFFDCMPAMSLNLGLKNCTLLLLPIYISIHILQFVTVMLVQGVLPIAACQMSWSCLSRTCCPWPHARSKPLLHAFILDRFLLFRVVLIRGCITQSPKSCLHLPGLKSPKIYYRGI